MRRRSSKRRYGRRRPVSRRRKSKIRKIRRYTAYRGGIRL